ncbi:hypothetical protein [Streptomyces misionensis]|uniref:hypothetical protein n=1 Tax=Streptomyces misionensis TaxID=67331 RepID=UPI0036BB207D
MSRLHPRGHQRPGERGDLVQLLAVPRERPAQALMEAEEDFSLLFGVGAEPFRGQGPRSPSGAAALVVQQSLAVPADHRDGRDLRVLLGDGNDVGPRWTAPTTPATRSKAA